MKRIPYIAYLPLIIASMIAYKLIDRIESVGGFLQLIVTILIPFIWAFVIAYLANPLLKKIETKLKWGRGLSIAIVYIIIISIVGLFFTLVIPSIAQSITDILKNVPKYMFTMEAWGNKQYAELEKLGLIESLENFDVTSLQEVFDRATTSFNSILTGLLTGVFGITSGVFKIFIGMVISIYMLKDKEAFLGGIKRINYAVLKVEHADKAVEFMREVDEVFSKYIIGKMIDSLIIGIICFVGMWFLKAPYALLMSIIIGVTNMIPYFGPFIGAVPAVLITLFTSPVTALWVALFILVLQQLDGYIIGPFILGDSVGLSPFWIILAILIGGGLFGILGMLICVPIMAIIRNQFNSYINKRLEEKDLSFQKLDVTSK